MLAAVGLVAHPAQALDPSRSLAQYAHEVWTTKDGVPDGAVTALRETSDGYLWLGTQCCLLRYDGDHFVFFDEGRIGVPQYSFVYGLVETSDRALWAGFIGGVARYASGQFTVYDGK